ncbi:TPA: hypothetical protein ACH3X1_003303 [Trebouxia sp. C0004]
MNYTRLHGHEEPVQSWDGRAVSELPIHLVARRRLPDEETPAASSAQFNSYKNLPGDDLLQSIPEHLINNILDQLPPDSLIKACYVCKSWNRLIQQDQYKCKRLAWHHKSFLAPGHVAKFRAKKRLLSCAAERRLNELTERVGKTMLLQV